MTAVNIKKNPPSSATALPNGATDPGPAPSEPLLGPQLVEDIEQFVKRYLVLPENAYFATVIWIIATYAAPLFDVFPYIAALSPQKRCGKTRLFEVLEVLTYHPWLGTAPSAAALYRMLADAPTLLVDEAEMFSAKTKSEATQIILAVLNAGHRKGATIPRCEPPKNEIRHFPVYGPKAFAAIGKLPDTLSDRSIIIGMQRKTKQQKTTPFRMRRAKAEATPIKAALARFVYASREPLFHGGPA
jgi:hypothetical protein